MTFSKVLLILLLISCCSFQSSSYAIDLQEKKVFEIALDDVEYNENENEMIQPADLLNFESFAEDERSYKPYPFQRLKRDEEILYETTEQNDTDFFKMGKYKNISDLKVSEEDATQSTEQVAISVTSFKETVGHRGYEYEDEEATFPDDNEQRKTDELTAEPLLIPIEKTTIRDTEPPDEEAYDYEQLKLEYEQQLMSSISQNKTLNYTDKDETEHTVEKTLKTVFDFQRPKNCTEEEASRFGIKAIQCFIHDYRHMKDKTNVRKLFLKLWLVLRIWLLIYICFAIPLWCQKGWCCCCFRCKFCFPRKRILSAKEYYAMNPPGVLVKLLIDGKQTDAVQYEPTELEQDAYEKFEMILRNM